MELTAMLPGPDDTFRLGVSIGRKLPAGSVVALYGSLGAGKTCLTQGIARGLGVPEDLPVVSPTFTLANEYPGRTPLFHLDVYRIDGEEFLAAGLDEYFDRQGVTVVEWAERIGGELPDSRLEVELEKSGSGGRRARLRAIGPDYEAVLRGIDAGLLRG